MAKRLICDPHHHLWQPETHSWWDDKEFQKHVAPALGGPRIFDDQYRIYLPSDLASESKKYKLDKSVYIECLYDGGNSDKSEVEWAQQLGDKYGFPTGIIGFVDLESDEAESILNEYMKSPGFRGIRPSLAWHDKYPRRRWAESPDIMMSPKFIQGLKYMASKGLILDLHIYPTQLRYAAIIAAAIPRLKIVINHCAYPLVENINDVMIWMKGIELMSKCKNVNIKISGWCIFDKDFSLQTMKFTTKYILDSFGVDRCMFASNFPVDKPHGDYDSYWDAYIQIATELGYTESDIDKLIHDNAIRIYRLDGKAQEINSKL